MTRPITLLLIFSSVFLTSCEIFTRSEGVAFHATGVHVPSVTLEQMFGFSYLDIWMSNDGKLAWTTTGKSLFFYVKGVGWRRDAQGGAAMGRGTVTKIVMSQDGKRGWGIGEGVFLKYEKGLGWTSLLDEIKLLGIENLRLTSIYTNLDGSEAWASGGDIYEGSVLLHFKESFGWRRDKSALGALGTSGFLCMAMSATLDRGWLVGQNVMLSYKKSVGWVSDEKGSDVIGTNHVQDLILNQSGTVGLAVGPSGFIATFNEQTGWSNESGISGEKPNSSFMGGAISHDGSEMWVMGVGSEGYSNLHFKKGAGWSEDENLVRILRHRAIFSVAMNSMGTEGWACGGGILLHYSAGDGWEIDRKKECASGNSLKAVTMNAKSGDGWAVGEEIILHYDSLSKWKSDSVGSLLGQGLTFTCLVINSMGTEVWVGSKENRLLHYKKGQGWTSQSAPAFDEMVLTNDDQQLWGLSNNALLKLENGQWIDQGIRPRLSHHVFTGLSINEDASEMWVVGTDMIMHFIRGVGWKVNEDNLRPGDRNLSSIYFNASGNNGLAVGFMNRILGYDGQRGWTRQDVPKSETQGGCYFYSALIDRSGNEAWAVGSIESGGVIAHKVNNQPWDLSEKAFATLSSIAYDEDKGEGWAVGEGGTIVHITSNEVSKKHLTIRNNGNMFRLKDSVTFVFPYKTHSMKVELGSFDGDQDFLKTSDSTYKVIQGGNDSTLTVVFNNATQSVLDRLSGIKCKFKLQVKVSEDFENWQNYESDSFEAKRTTWQSLLSGTGLISVVYLLISISLLLLAVPYPWFREKIFGDDFSDILKFFKINGLVLKPILVFFKPIKFALLRDYRSNLLNHPSLKQWGETKTYNPPQIGDTADEDPVAVLWNRIIVHKLKANAWVIEGRSGLGKTALLEQLALKAIASGKTPLLIKLNLFNEPGDYFKNVFAEDGRLMIDASTAKKLVLNGGFILLLDGLNESSNQEAIKSFIKASWRNNIIVLTTQDMPTWQDMSVENVKIRPFGEKQLCSIMENPALVTDLMAAKHLFDFNNLDDANRGDPVGTGFLPFTAMLIAKYAASVGTLPNTRLEIYNQLISQVRSESQFLNLQDKTWRLFCENAYNILPDDPRDFIDGKFLLMARDNEIMSQVAIKKETLFRYRHEKIFRFVVATYLSKTHSEPNLIELHAMLKVKQERYYWIDVFEFWGEIILEGDIEEAERIKRYERFLLSVSNFEIRIVKERLLSQLFRYCSQNDININPDFERTLLLRIVSRS